MATKGIEVVIAGRTPLLMHAFPMVTIEAEQNRTPQEQADLHVYRDPDARLFVPAINIQRALIAGAVYSKGKGRASLQKNAAACVLISPERLLLGTDKYEIDSRPVVIPATKGRIVRHRARFDDWRLTFEVEYDDVLLNADQLRRIVDDTGSRVGLLDFRPEKKGMFGRFMIVEWKAA